MTIYDIKLMVDGVVRNYVFSLSKKEEHAASQGFLNREEFIEIAKQNTIKKLLATGCVVEVIA